MADNGYPDYKSLFLQAEERLKQEEERRKQEEERRKQAEEEGRRERERNRQTTLDEFICHCHDLLSRPLRVEFPSRSTTGTIPLPTGKYCPTQLRSWTDCPAQQQEVYNSVYRYLQPSTENTQRLFPPLLELEGIGRRFDLRPISSEQGLETYERIAVEDHVRDIIAELCKVPAAQDEFGLGDGVWFDNHTNALNESEALETDTNHRPNVRHPRPDQFCIHRVDGNTSTLLLTVEYKPPHKLSVENLRAGLRPMELWENLVKRNTIPTDPEEKLRYNAERLVNSAIVQEYHVMIEEGREYSYVTNGLARVLLYVPYDDPSTLYYYLCEPNREVDGQDKQQPKTSIARVLCLCLMSFRSPPRDQEWRNSARSRLHIWRTSFDHAHSQIPKEELQQNPPHTDSTDSEYVSSEHTGSEYQPSSFPVEPLTTQGRRVPTRSQARCAPSDLRHRTESPDSSGSDTNQEASGRKRGFSQVASSPPVQPSARQWNPGNRRSGQSRGHDAQFCTQRCLLGQQNGGVLDDCCPNLELHRQGRDDSMHPINAEGLVCSLKRQLDKNIDQNCTPFGTCGAYGAPFKLTDTAYGYTVVGKGTTSGLWKEVSREAEIYQILRKAQGSAVPVVLGNIDLAKVYFLHGAGEIRHMLLMAWGGESTAEIKRSSLLRREILRSRKEIHSLGIVHQDLRSDNILWNDELGRALIIDFHRSKLDCRPTLKRQRAANRPLRKARDMRSKESTFFL